MARIDCGSASHVPCRCDPVTGCGHASSWHRVTERWVAKCTVQDCECPGIDVCNCVEGADEPSKVERDADVLGALGILMTAVTFVFVALAVGG